MSFLIEMNGAESQTASNSEKNPRARRTSASREGLALLDGESPDGLCGREFVSREHEEIARDDGRPHVRVERLQASPSAP